MGDLWSLHIYKNLRDTNVIVRKNTLMVLTHLILNDMIKVRDSISEIALLLEDSHASISDLARLFFQELSKKGKNPIYNILPDTISRLSNNEQITDETFKYIMKFLLAFICRDKQKENLIEKLCNRYSSSTDLRSWRYISYCLSLLNYSDRLMRKVCDEELVKKYADKVYDDEIFSYFREIQAKCKKHVSLQYKETFDSWVAYIAQRHAEGKQDEATNERAMQNLNKKTKKQKRQKKKQTNSESDSNSNDEMDIDELLESDNESEDESESEQQVQRQRGRGRGRGSKAKKAKSARARGRGRGRGRGRAAKSSKREADATDSDEDDDDDDEEEESEQSIVEEESSTQSD